MALTEHLIKIIPKLPKSTWFGRDDAHGFRRTVWALDRLVDDGILSTKVKWENQNDLPMRLRTDFNTVRLYKLKKNFISKIPTDYQFLFIQKENA